MNCQQSQYSPERHQQFFSQLIGRLLSDEDGASLRVDHCLNCDGYHKGWLVLQALGVISGLQTERAHICRDIQTLHQSRTIRSVLIAGCADFGLLSVLHQTFSSEVKNLAITVADRCMTPLQQCHLYAQSMGFEIRTHCTDILDLEQDEQYDLVIGHSILSFIPPSDRSRMIGGLIRNLRLGGSLLLYQSLRKISDVVKLTFKQEEVDELVVRAISELSNLDQDLRKRLDPPKTEEITRRFCAQKSTYPVQDFSCVESWVNQGELSLIYQRMLFNSTSSHRAATPKSEYGKFVSCAQRQVIGSVR